MLAIFLAVIVVVVLRFCFFLIGLSRKGESSASTREAASLTTTGASTAKVEACTSGKASSTAREAAGTTREATGAESASSEAALVAHHAEENLGVDATHAAAHATGTEHISRVNKVVAVVIASSLPAPCVSTLSLIKKLFANI